MHPSLCGAVAVYARANSNQLPTASFPCKSRRSSGFIGVILPGFLTFASAISHLLSIDDPVDTIRLYAWLPR